jgi:hypothetical protein
MNKQEQVMDRITCYTMMMWMSLGLIAYIIWSISVLLYYLVFFPILIMIFHFNCKLNNAYFKQEMKKVKSK